MTTAARPTFDPARGGQGRGEKDLSAISRQYSSRDLPGHTKLKYREQGQGTTDELRSRDFRKELDDREKDEAERKQEEERIRMENILSGNPLLNYSAAGQKNDLKVKRRWDDDVVFKNCARSEPEKKLNTFINDSLRSEFHKKFMEKYVK
ncbi:Pre-mRNA-splicing factor cwc15 [Operophtera brumata]|uniref:Pre-mRNA-splicing factor cwc15 n=1 Tax=Operophtera brumata TaxID=104452 RepID=A0A0L7LSF9_OPEBR|nr:Pre-mRNA-splicing factor cwc15 [Operophtera brumata]